MEVDVSKRAGILLVEDDSVLAREIVNQCAELGLEVEHISDGEFGYQRALTAAPALVILDVKLPNKNGLDICRDLKREMPTLPVILLTSRDTEVDKVLGFELGADDYVTKPFHMTELVARIRARLRQVAAFREHIHSQGDENARTFAAGEFLVELDTRTIHKRGIPLTLTAKEFELLYFFLTHVGRVFTKTELLYSVWQLDVAGGEDAVVSMVKRLRTKIEDDPANPVYLCTHRGVGYRFSTPSHSSEHNAGGDSDGDENGGAGSP